METLVTKKWLHVQYASLEEGTRRKEKVRRERKWSREQREKMFACVCIRVSVLQLMMWDSLSSGIVKPQNVGQEAQRFPRAVA